MKDDKPPRPADIEVDVEEVILEIDGLSEDDGEMEMLEALEEFDLLESSANEGRNSPVQDDAIYTFQEHSKPVMACALHPISDLCTTGGFDCKVFLWNRKTGEVVHENTEHKDDVYEIHFNHDGTYLASGDFAGVVMVHEVQQANGGSDKDGILTLRKVLSLKISPLLWMQWHKAANVLFAGSDDGEIAVCQVPSGDCKFLPGNGKPCVSGDLTNDGLKVFAAYENGMVKLWDINSRTVVMEINGEHPLAVCCHKENPIYAVSDEDGKIVFCTPSGPMGHVHADGYIECLSFSPSADFRMVASGALQGKVAVWDYTKLSLYIQCEEPGAGVSKLQWISEFTLLVATTRGYIIAYDARTGQRKFTFSGHLHIVHSFSYDPRESLLLTVSEDKTAKIFKVPELGD